MGNLLDIRDRIFSRDGPAAYRGRIRASTGSWAISGLTAFCESCRSKLVDFPAAHSRSIPSNRGCSLPLDALWSFPCPSCRTERALHNFERALNPAIFTTLYFDDDSDEGWSVEGLSAAFAPAHAGSHFFAESLGTRTCSTFAGETDSASGRDWRAACESTFDDSLRALFQRTLAWRDELHDGPLSYYLLGFFRADSTFEPLRDRRHLLHIYDASRSPVPGSTTTPFAAHQDGEYLHFQIGIMDGATRTLSMRALDRVWTSLAESLAQRRLDSYDAFLNCFRTALVDAVERESVFVHYAGLAFEDLPSTCVWVHLFSLHTGLSPPASNTDVPFGNGAERVDYGGRDGLVRRQETQEHLRPRRRGGRFVGRLLHHPAEVGYLNGHTQPQVPLGRRDAVFEAGRPAGRPSYPGMVNQFRLDRGCWPIPNAA